MYKERFGQEWLLYTSVTESSEEIKLKCLTSWQKDKESFEVKLEIHF